MVSFSSLEHSGLGRYGDQLNPHGDLIAMARYSRTYVVVNFDIANLRFAA